jgi:hypothetical protein
MSTGCPRRGSHGRDLKLPAVVSGASGNRDAGRSSVGLTWDPLSQDSQTGTATHMARRDSPRYRPWLVSSFEKFANTASVLVT